MADDPLLPARGGYRKLRSFQLAPLVYDVIVRFCDRHIRRKSRTHDQMVQAARSGVRNIAAGSEASATSKKMELKLTQVARASLEELRLVMKTSSATATRRLRLWPRHDTRRKALVMRRCRTADEVAPWIKEVASHGRYGPDGKGLSMDSIPSIPAASYPELSANAALPDRSGWRAARPRGGFAGRGL